VRVTVAEYSSLTGPYFEEAAAAFEAANPEHDIQIEVVPWDVMLQKLTTDISAGANADLSIIGTRWLVDFVAEGIAAPLDGYMSDEFSDRFIEVFLTPSVFDGQTYGLPIAASARAMFYNTELFEQAGLDGPPDTWEELKEAAAAIDALGDDIAGFGMQGAQIETDVYFYYACWAYGGELTPARIAHFLILNRQFPRSLLTCIGQATDHLEHLSRGYGRGTSAQACARRMLGELAEARVEEIFDEGLHEFLTRFIGENAALAQAVHDSYLTGEAR